MRRLLMLMIVAVSLTAASSAFAQYEGGETRSKFYNFDDMLIDGKFKKPDIMKKKARRTADFNRLLNLKKDFLPKVIQTSEEQALQ